MLAGALRQRSIDILTTCEPGGTPLGRRLREAFLETEENVAPIAELLLFAADRAQHVEVLIKPSLEAGRMVISDRYADATFAYQGAGRGFAENTVKQIIRIATGGLKPDLTLFFDISVETALKRLRSRSEAGERINRMDAETADFYGRVRAAYLGIADRDPKRFKVIEANGSVEEIQARVKETVEPLINAREEASA